MKYSYSGEATFRVLYPLTVNARKTLEALRAAAEEHEDSGLTAMRSPESLRERFEAGDTDVEQVFSLHFSDHEATEAKVIAIDNALVEMARETSSSFVLEYHFEGQHDVIFLGPTAEEIAKCRLDHAIDNSIREITGATFASRARNSSRAGRFAGALRSFLMTFCRFEEEQATSHLVT